MMLESTEHARFRALAQVMIDKEKGVEAFDEYMKVAFPYLESVKRRDREVYIKELQQWVKENKTGIKVTPLTQPKATSRLKTRWNQAQLPPRTPRMQQQGQTLTKKIGALIPK